MRCFEITLQGFNPNASDTDHLIKWVLAPSIQFVQLWLASTRLNTYLQEMPQEMGDHAASYDWEDGVDVKLDTAGKATWNPMYPANVTTWKEQVSSNYLGDM
jgi:hypothetical protein